MLQEFLLPGTIASYMLLDCCRYAKNLYNPDFNGILTLHAIKDG